MGRTPTPTLLLISTKTEAQEQHKELTLGIQIICIQTLPASNPPTPASKSRHPPPGGGRECFSFFSSSTQCRALPSILKPLSPGHIYSWQMKRISQHTTHLHGLFALTTLIRCTIFSVQSMFFQNGQMQVDSTYSYAVKHILISGVDFYWITTCNDHFFSSVNRLLCYNIFKLFGGCQSEAYFTPLTLQVMGDVLELLPCQLGFTPSQVFEMCNFRD